MTKKKIVRKKTKKKHVSHHRKKHPLPFNFFSGFIYIVAVIAAISLGALFFKSVKDAKKKVPSKTSSRAQLDLPPGATVVRRGERRPQRTTASKPARKKRKKKDLGSIKLPAPPKEKEEAPPPPEPENAPVVRSEGTLHPSPQPRWEHPSVEMMEELVLSLIPTADTSIFAEPASMRNNNTGADEQLYLKGNDSYALMNFDLKPIQGWTIRRATWHARLKKGPVRALGFSTISKDWSEGSGTAGSEASNGATYNWADYQAIPWTARNLPGPCVVRGNRGTYYCEAAPDRIDDQEGKWLVFEIDPILVQTMLAGESKGLAVFDAKGRFTSTPITFLSRDTSDIHYLEVEGQVSDLTPPGDIQNLTLTAPRELRGRNQVGVILSWTATGDDRNEGQAFTYDIRYSNRGLPFNQAERIRQPLMPIPPRAAGQTDQVILEGLDPTTTYSFYVCAIDEVGQSGPVSELTASTPAALPLEKVPPPETFSGTSLDICKRQLSLTVSDQYTALDPFSARPCFETPTPSTDSSLWQRDARTIHLEALQNETLLFTLNLRNRSRSQAFPPVQVRANALQSAEHKIPEDAFTLYRTVYHLTRNKQRKAVSVADALVPVKGRLQVPWPELRINKQRCQTLLAEYTVPADTPPGLYRGILSFNAKGTESQVNVMLTVLPAACPVDTAFTVELQGVPTVAALYGKSINDSQDAQPIESAYQRMARRHRCTLASRPYSPSGEHPAPFTPTATGHALDLHVKSWGAWDERYTPRMTGQVFENESNTHPVKHIILPFFENWPQPFNEGYTCVGWNKKPPRENIDVYAGPSTHISQCLKDEYWQGLRAIARDFGSHFSDAAWNQTIAHFWFANDPTNTYSGMAPTWFLGTPAYRDDFMALEAYAGLLDPNTREQWPVNPAFRVHVPYAETLQQYGLSTFDLLAVGDTNWWALPLLAPRAQLYNKSLWKQSDHVPLNGNNLALPGRGLQAFLAGAEGWSVGPAVGTPQDWKIASPNALLYCGSFLKEDRPYASLRLKALNRLQQDFALLEELQRRNRWSSQQLRDYIQMYLPEGAATPPNAQDWERLRHAVRMELAAE